MTQALAAQFIGLIAVGISLSIFQTNKRHTMLKLGMLAAVFYGFHFFLLGAYTGAAMGVIGGARCFMFSRWKPNREHTWILIMFMTLSVLATWLTWQGPLSLLALGGSLATSFAGWHKKPKQIRRWSLAAPPMWFTYDALSGSYPGMLIEIIMLTSNFVGELRFDIGGREHTRVHVARPS